MYFIILLLNILNYSYANKNFIANSFYQNNDCEDLNYIIYSYNELDICKNLLNDTICNEFSIYSNKQYCGKNDLEDTKKNMKEFLYLETSDDNCENIIGAFSIKLNKCISFMDLTYIKITKSNNYFKSTNYLDPICSEKYIPTNKNEKGFDLNKCLSKIKIYTNKGEITNSINSINNDNIDDNSINDKIDNSAKNKYRINKFILTCIFSTLLIFILIL